MVCVCLAAFLLYLYIILFCFLAKMLKTRIFPNNLPHLPAPAPPRLPAPEKENFFAKTT